MLAKHPSVGMLPGDLTDGLASAGICIWLVCGTVGGEVVGAAILEGELVPEQGRVLLAGS